MNNQQDTNILTISLHEISGGVTPNSLVCEHIKISLIGSYLIASRTTVRQINSK